MISTINKKYIISILALCMIINFSADAQKKTPIIFKWQDNHAKNIVGRYLKKDAMIKMDETTIHINYSMDKNKPYLLLIQGMGSNARSNYRREIKALSKKYNLLLPDLIYFGESTSTSNNYSPDYQAEQIHKVINLLGITEKINVMGYSYGGLVAAMYNEKYPESVNKLIIVDGLVKYLSKEKSDSLANAVGAKALIDVVVPCTLQDFDASQKAISSKKMQMSNGIKRKVIAYYFTPFKDIRLLQSDYLINNQTRYQQYNYNLDKTKTLLIWGEKDGVVPLETGQKLHANFPNTELIVYPNVKHDLLFSQPKKLSRDVIKFLGKE